MNPTTFRLMRYSAMAKIKTLIMGTAPKSYVKRIIKNYKDKDRELHVIVKNKRRNDFCEDHYEIYGFGKYIHWYNLALLFQMFRIKPDEIVIVCGDTFFHRNVVKTLTLFGHILKNEVEIFVSVGGEEPEIMTTFYGNSFKTKWLIFAVISFLGLLAFSTYIVGIKVIPIFLVAMILAELLLQNMKQCNHFNRLIENYGRMGMERAIKVTTNNTRQARSRFDEQLGWKNLPNEDKLTEVHIPRLGCVHTWKASSDETGCRKTSKDSAKHIDNYLVVSILGCSLTYGVGLNDENTYAWQLQEKFPQKQVKNYGVAGYSLYQMLLVLERTIETDKPEVVVLGFFYDHELRNTNSFRNRIYQANRWRNPSCISKRGKLRRFPPKGYNRLPLGEIFEITKLLEFNLNNLRFIGRGNNKIMRTTTEHLLLKIRSLCEKNNSKFLIACLDYSEPYYEFFMKHGFSWCITGVNRSELTDDVRSRWTLYPFDGHPNQEANKRYAKVIGDAIERVLAGKHVSPELELIKDQVKTGKPESFIYPHF